MSVRSAIQIPGAVGWWQETTARYAVDTHGITCPICGGLGLNWAGWFHCDGTCQAIAVIADGRTFVPVRMQEEMP